MNKNIFTKHYVCILLLLSGCATINPKPDYQRVQDHVTAATSQPFIYEPCQENFVTDKVDQLLADGIAIDEAVQISLLKNPTIRAQLARIGLARADVVQAGLLSNPTLGVSLRFPESGGLANLEAGIAQNIADLWMIPARKRAAERDLDRTILDVAREVANLVYDTKIAYYNAITADESLTIAQDNLTVTQELQRVTQARLEAGLIGSVDVNLIRGQVLKAEVDVRLARLNAANARRNLTVLLGLTLVADDLVLNDKLPAPLDQPIDPEQLVAIARESRLDLRAAQDNVLAAYARIEAEFAKVFQNVEVGLGLERPERRAMPGQKILADTARASIANGQLTAPEIESRGQRQLEKNQMIEATLGPSLSISLPIFDQNQAQIAKARFSYVEAEALLDALDRVIVQEARSAVDQTTTAWGVASLYDREVLPQARTTLDLSRSTYQAGNAPILAVIDAQRSLLEVRRAYIATLQNAANAVVDLERVTARPATILFNLVTQTQPSSQPQGVNP